MVGPGSPRPKAPKASPWPPPLAMPRMLHSAPQHANPARRACQWLANASFTFKLDISSSYLIISVLSFPLQGLEALRGCQRPFTEGECLTPSKQQRRPCAFRAASLAESCPRSEPRRKCNLTEALPGSGYRSPPFGPAPCRFSTPFDRPLRPQRHLLSPMDARPTTLTKT